MSNTSLHLVLVSTPIGHLGSGRGGGVELTLTSLLRGLAARGHRITLVAPNGSVAPDDCPELSLHTPLGAAINPAGNMPQKTLPFKFPLMVYFHICGTLLCPWARTPMQ